MRENSKFKIMDEVVDQASRRLGEAQRMEYLIQDIQEKGISLGIRQASNRFTEHISDKTKSIIESIVIAELNDKMETASKQLKNILGGKENGE